MRDFKVKDFDGGGQYLVCTTKDYIGDSAALSTLTYKVGYQYRGARGKPALYLISMADGWIQDGYKDGDDWVYFEGDNMKEADKALVKYLNGKSQEFRFATQDEIIRVVRCQVTRWRNT
jgi:hypothetical protein